MSRWLHPPKWPTSEVAIAPPGNVLLPGCGELDEIQISEDPIFAAAERGDHEDIIKHIDSLPDPPGAQEAALSFALSLGDFVERVCRKLGIEDEPQPVASRRRALHVLPLRDPLRTGFALGRLIPGRSTTSGWQLGPPSTRRELGHHDARHIAPFVEKIDETERELLARAYSRSAPVRFIPSNITPSGWLPDPSSRGQEPFTRLARIGALLSDLSTQRDFLFALVSESRMAELELVAPTRYAPSLREVLCTSLFISDGDKPSGWQPGHSSTRQERGQQDAGHIAPSVATDHETGHETFTSFWHSARVMERAWSAMKSAHALASMRRDWIFFSNLEAEKNRRLRDWLSGNAWRSSQSGASALACWSKRFSRIAYRSRDTPWFGVEMSMIDKVRDSTAAIQWAGLGNIHEGLERLPGELAEHLELAPVEGRSWAATFCSIFHAAEALGRLRVMTEQACKEFSSFLGVSVGFSLAALLECRAMASDTHLLWKTCVEDAWFRAQGWRLRLEELLEASGQIQSRKHSEWRLKMSSSLFLAYVEHGHVDPEVTGDLGERFDAWANLAEEKITGSPERPPFRLKSHGYVESNVKGGLEKPLGAWVKLAEEEIAGAPERPQLPLESSSHSPYSPPHPGLASSDSLRTRSY